MTGMNITNIRELKLVRPSNVIHVNNVSNQFSNKQYHPATFPNNLVSFFIKIFSNPKDIVLDPFMGSGTTGYVAKGLNRNFIGMELKQEYFDLATKTINRIKYQPEEIKSPLGMKSIFGKK